jgi:hypothetical protein
MEIKYTLKVHPEETSVRGNALASGDNAEDRKGGIMMEKGKHYRVAGWSAGVAWYFFGYPKVWEEITSMEYDPDLDREVEIHTGEGEWVDGWEERGEAIMIMVGDDQKFTVSIEDCTEISDLEFCRDCGQIGCTSNVYE